MKLILETGELYEPERQARGQVLRCEAGTCWLTTEGDSRDLLLRAGQQCELPRHRRVVVTALCEVRIQLFDDVSDSTVSGITSWFFGLKKRALA